MESFTVAPAMRTRLAPRCHRERRSFPDVHKRKAGGARNFVTAAVGTVDYSDNLGQLGRLKAVTQTSDEEIAMILQRADPASFSDQGLYIDGGSIFASLVLLLVLLAFSTNRIFGLDRFLVSAARLRREEQRKEDVQKLQRMMENGGTAGGPPEDPDGTSGNAS